MPKKNRRDTVYDNSVHHVVQRGLNRARIFNEQSDYEKFKLIMYRYLKEYSVLIYNYCFIPNHIHLLLYVKERAHLSSFMHDISLAYSSYYRYTYKYVGYLWQGRFKNFLIEKDSYLLECARYIERNPLRVKYKMAEDLSQYPWSSYNFYSKSNNDSLVTPNPLYEALGKTPHQKQQNYQEYILSERPYDTMLDDIFRI
jgi:putative transposase